MRTRGKWEALAVERHQRDLALAKRKSGHPRGLLWVPELAERPIEFIERFCKHHKGEWAGKPLLLERWQKDDVVRPLFGWMRPDGTRRFRKAWIEIPRKNGKTELAAGLGVYLVVGDGEPGAEVYCTATKQEQAKLLWDAAAAMVRASPALRRWCKTHRSRGGTIFCDRLGSKMLPLGSDSKTLDGLNPHGDLRDEVHQWVSADLAAVLDTAMGARRQPLTIEITTAGVFNPTGVGWKHHEYATQVLQGAFDDDEQFVFIAAIDDGDDPFSPATWEKANPNIDVSVKRAFLASAAEKAKRVPSELNDFLRLNCNRWTAQVTRWISPDHWRECDPVERPEEARATREEALRKREGTAGLDLASRLDLVAFVMALPAEEGTVDLVCRFWLPEGTIEEETRAGRRHYQQWVEQGWIIATPGATTDYDMVKAEVVELLKQFPGVSMVGYDPFNAHKLAGELESEHGLQMVELRQGFLTLSEPSKEFEAKVAERTMRHGGNPVLAWMVGNAVIKKDPAGNIKPDKEKAKGKIDGVVAAIMALKLLATSGGGPYSESAGLVTLAEPPRPAAARPPAAEPSSTPAAQTEVLADDGFVDDPSQVHPFVRALEQQQQQPERVNPFLLGE